MCGARTMADASSRSPVPASNAVEAMQSTLQRMKEECRELEFETRYWRDSGAQIIVHLDDVQAMVQDQLSKLQLMRSASESAAFGQRAAGMGDNA